MHRQTVQLEEEVAPAKPRTSPTGQFFQSPAQKYGVLVLVLGLLYLRLFKKRRAKLKVCSHCSQKNPTHLTNCAKCGAPLF